MSVQSDIGRNILADRLYKYGLHKVYGVLTGNIDIMQEYNRYMIIKVLEWNDTENYLTSDQVQCLNGIVQRPSKICNC